MHGSRAFTLMRVRMPDDRFDEDANLAFRSDRGAVLEAGNDAQEVTNFRAPRSWKLVLAST